jgi:hypothetical protein
VNNTYFFLILIITASVVPVTAMFQSKIIGQAARQKKLTATPTTISPKKSIEQVSSATTSHLADESCPEGSILLHQEGTSHGVCFSPEIIALSKTLNNMIGDLVSEENPIKENYRIPIVYSNATLSHVQIILQQYATEADTEKKKTHIINAVSDLSFESLLDTTNCLNYLDCPPEIENTVINLLKKQLSSSPINAGSTAFSRCIPDIKKVILEPITAWLRMENIKNHALERKKEVDFFKLPETSFDTLRSHTFLPSTVMTSYDRKIIIYDNKDILVKAAQSHQDFILTSISADHTYLAYIERTRDFFDPASNLYIENLRSFEKPIIIPYKKNITALAFSPCNKYLAIGFGKYNNKTDNNINNIIIYDRESKTVLQTLSTSCFSIFSLLFTADSATLIAGGENQPENPNVQLWNVETGELINEFLAQKEFVSNIFLNKDKTKLITIGSHKRTFYNSISNWNNSTVSIWDINTFKHISSTIIPSLERMRGVLSAAFDQDRNILLIGDASNRKNNPKLQVPALPKEYSTFLSLNISDPENIIAEYIPSYEYEFSSLNVSPNGKNMLSINEAMGMLGNLYYNLTIWTLFTEEDEKTIEDIIRYTPDQMEVLYTLRYQKEKVDPEKFALLPDTMRNLLSAPVTNSSWSISSPLDWMNSSDLFNTIKSSVWGK